jgi:SAM-dependent methyltransferase
VADSWNRYWRVVDRILPTARAPMDRFIDRLVASGSTKRWLDAGSGRQSFPAWRSSDYRAFLDTGVRHYGCDLDLAALRESEIAGRVCLATLDRIPYATASFDLVTSNMVFEHLTDPGTAVDEMIRVTKPGGRILIHTVNALSYLAWIAHLTPHRFHEWIVSRVEGRDAKDIYPTVYRANTLGRLRDLFESRGARLTWGGEICALPIHVPYRGLFWVAIAVGVLENWISRVPWVGRMFRPNLLVEFVRSPAAEIRSAQ